MVATAERALITSATCNHIRALSVTGAMLLSFAYIQHRDKSCELLFRIVRKV